MAYDYYSAVSPSSGSREGGGRETYRPFVQNACESEVLPFAMEDHVVDPSSSSSPGARRYAEEDSAEGKQDSGGSYFPRSAVFADAKSQPLSNRSVSGSGSDNSGYEGSWHGGLQSSIQFRKGMAGKNAASSSAPFRTEPTLLHSISHDASSSVLSVAVDVENEQIFSGTQSACIDVWDLHTYTRRSRLCGHDSSVLALEFAQERNWLFSSSGDNTVRIWCTARLIPLGVIYPADDNVGDIFALKWCEELETLFLGCQNTSIQWINLAGLDCVWPASKSEQVLFEKQSVRRARPSSASTVGNAGYSVGDSVPLQRSASTGINGASELNAARRPSTTFTSNSAGSPSQGTGRALPSSGSNGMPAIYAKPNKFFDSAPTPLSSSPHTPAVPSGLSARTSNGRSTPKGNSNAHSGTTREADYERAGAGGATLPESLSRDSVVSEQVNGGGQEEEVPVQALQLCRSCQIRSAHFGYIYALELVRLAPLPSSEGSSGSRIMLISGSGDEEIKLWQAMAPPGNKDSSSLRLMHVATLRNSEAGVLTLATWQSTLFAGLQGGLVDVWDLETLTVLRTLKAAGGPLLNDTAGEVASHQHGHDQDVLSISTLRAPNGKGFAMFTACADGTIKRFDARFRCVGQWKGHDGVVLCTAIVSPPSVPGALASASQSTPSNLSSSLNQAMTPPTAKSYIPSEAKLITGGSDTLLKVWACDTLGGARGAGGLSSMNGVSPFSNANGNAALAALSLLGTSLDSAPSTPLGAAASLPAGGSDTPTSAALDFKAMTKEQYDAMMIRSLADFVAFPSVGGLDENREQCRQCALWLKDCLTGLGAEARMIAGAQGRNPLVMATFKGRSSLSGANTGVGSSSSAPRRRKRCLFYGHYDCIGADGKWKSDPWTVTGRDGYLYGRGVSDNKGPTLAVAFAASQLLSRRELEIDLVMLVEGEEERGSVGFQEALAKVRHEIGDIDVVLLSNSYWLGEDTPCLTVGLRGVVQATVKITGRIPDVHSGVEGGAVREPMMDMVRLLGSASAGDKILIPEFYDSVRQVTPAERQLYESIVKMKQSRARNAEDLIARWRLPTLSIHRITVSGPGNNTVIPNTVEASVSIRIVPDQSLQRITSSLINHIITSFKQLNSSNELSVSIDHSADWWSGKEDSPFATVLASAIEAEWGRKPVNICEGGSIPAVAILEKQLNATAVHLPMGQASDSAHLSDERIRLLNLQKGKAVISRFFKALPTL